MDPIDARYEVLIDNAHLENRLRLEETTVVELHRECTALEQAMDRSEAQRALAAATALELRSELLQERDKVDAGLVEVQRVKGLLGREREEVASLRAELNAVHEATCQARREANAAAASAARRETELRQSVEQLQLALVAEARGRTQAQGTIESLKGQIEAAVAETEASISAARSEEERKMKRLRLQNELLREEAERREAAGALLGRGGMPY